MTTDEQLTEDRRIYGCAYWIAGKNGAKERIHPSTVWVTADGKLYIKGRTTAEVHEELT